MKTPSHVQIKYEGPQHILSQKNNKIITVEESSHVVNDKIITTITRFITRAKFSVSLDNCYLNMLGQLDEAQTIASRWTCPNLVNQTIT